MMQSTVHITETTALLITAYLTLLKRSSSSGIWSIYFQIRCRVFDYKHFAQLRSCLQIVSRYFPSEPLKHFPSLCKTSNKVVPEVQTKRMIRTETQ